MHGLPFSDTLACIMSSSAHLSTPSFQTTIMTTTEQHDSTGEMTKSYEVVIRAEEVLSWDHLPHTRKQRDYDHESFYLLSISITHILANQAWLN